MFALIFFSISYILPLFTQTIPKLFKICFLVYLSNHTIIYPTVSFSPKIIRVIKKKFFYPYFTQYKRMRQGFLSLFYTIKKSAIILKYLCVFPKRGQRDIPPLNFPYLQPPVLLPRLPFILPSLCLQFSSYAVTNLQYYAFYLYFIILLCFQLFIHSFAK